MDAPESTPVRCAKCDRQFEIATVKIGYMKETFEVEMLQCPQCKQVYVSEDLALGKMARVEKELEDK